MSADKNITYSCSLWEMRIRVLKHWMTVWRITWDLTLRWRSMHVTHVKIKVKRIFKQKSWNLLKYWLSRLWGKSWSKINKKIWMARSSMTRRSKCKHRKESSFMICITWLTTLKVNVGNISLMSPGTLLLTKNNGRSTTKIKNPCQKKLQRVILHPPTFCSTPRKDLANLSSTKMENSRHKPSWPNGRKNSLVTKKPE